MRWRVAGVVVLVLAILAPRAMAQSAPDPSTFALPAALFPPGSQIIASRVADNFDVILHHDQAGPQPTAGRVTGYYMQAQSQGPSGLRLATSYLVSLFDNSADAADALAQQDAYWHSFDASSVQALPAPDLGDPNQVHWYSLTDGNGNTHSELFFRRGSVFVELNLYDFQGTPGPDDTAAFLSMADQLDVDAGRPTTPTAVPTATATATAAPSPTSTATVVPPSPTATVQAVAPRPETKPCKKGFKRLHGKCRRKKS